MRIVTIVGARPQFIKAAVVSRAIRLLKQKTENVPRIAETIIHTGQHYDPNMSDVFFHEMDIPRPDHNLGIGSAAHGAMTGRMIERIESLLLDSPPDWVLVFGDTNSTLAGTLAAAKLNIPIAHIEAGLRSFNRRMPEEINRVLTDHAASLLFAPTAAAVENLHREGISPDRIERVGDVMYDAALFFKSIAAEKSTILHNLDLEPRHYALATVHRAENTDDRDRLEQIIRGLARIAEQLPVILPLHPRTRKMIAEFDLLERANEFLNLIEPVGYLDMTALETSAALIATDSGGVQKEAFFNRVPCLTLRDETEWIELVEIGANTITGANADTIAEAARNALHSTVDESNLYGNGYAGESIIARLLAH